MVKTLTGEIFGTPLYTSPEQAAGGSKDVGPAADIYSLGVILYELWTGQVPFPGDTVTAIFVGHLTQAPKPPTDLNPHLSQAQAAVLLKALAKQPGDRYRTADELGEALARLGPARKADERDATAAQVRAARTLLIRRATPVPLRVPRFSRRQQRTFGWYAAAGAAILLLGIALGAALRSPTTAVTSGGSIPVVTPPAGAAVPAPVLIQIASIPAGATVMRAGKRLGVTPTTLESLPSEPPFEITVELARHEPARVLVDPTKSAHHTLALSRVEPRKPAGPRRPRSPHTEDDLLKSEFR